GSKSSPACCRPCNRFQASGPSFVMRPVGGATASSKLNGTSIQIRCGHDGQRKRVAHMPTATTTTEDSRSNLVHNHPHDFTMKQKRYALFRQRFSGAALTRIQHVPASRRI